MARRALAIAAASRAPFPGKDAARKALAALKQPLQSAAVTPPRPDALPGLSAVRDRVARPDILRKPNPGEPAGALPQVRAHQEALDRAAWAVVLAGDLIPGEAMGVQPFNRITAERSPYFFR